jgi:phosphatidylglycerol:prolipoprotein diacylglycerol transferase
MRTAVITIGIDPEIHLGPLTVAWHGLTIALGILLGAWLAGRWLTRRGHDPEPMYTLTMLLAASGIIGGRLFYVLEHGGPLLATRGFTFDGGLIAAAITMAVAVRRMGLRSIYLDAIALALPVGIALGRVGDVINGEHYGAQSTGLLAVRNSSPNALTPNSMLAYQNGGLYEVLLGVAVLVVMVPLRDRMPREGDLAWLVIALFSIGRFFEFFLRADSPQLALGLNNAQWTSVVILGGVVVGRAAQVRFRPGRVRGTRSPQEG